MLNILVSFVWTESDWIENVKSFNHVWSPPEIKWLLLGIHSRRCKLQVLQVFKLALAPFNFEGGGGGLPLIGVPLPLSYFDKVSIKYQNGWSIILNDINLMIICIVSSIASYYRKNFKVTVFNIFLSAYICEI